MPRGAYDMSTDPTKIQVFEDATATPAPHAVPETTRVWFVQGKANNKAFRTALSLHRENADLSEANKENIPPKDDKKKDSEHDQREEA